MFGHGTTSKGHVCGVYFSHSPNDFDESLIASLDGSAMAPPARDKFVAVACENDDRLHSHKLCATAHAAEKAR